MSLLMAGPFKVPSNPYHSMILWLLHCTWDSQFHKGRVLQLLVHNRDSWDWWILCSARNRLWSATQPQGYRSPCAHQPLPWHLTNIWLSSLFPNSPSLSSFSFREVCLHSSLSSLVLNIFVWLFLVSLSSHGLYSLLPLVIEAFIEQIFQHPSPTLWLKWMKPTITRMFSLCGVQRARLNCPAKHPGDGTPNPRRRTDASQPIFRSQALLRNPGVSQRR